MIFFRHPDKSKHPKAEEKFIEITKAYDLLLDPDRRNIYDNYGILNEDSIYLKKHNNKYGVHSDFVNPFDEDISLFHEMSISHKYFDQFVLPKSTSVPFIIIVYSNFCLKCSSLIPIIHKLQEILDPLGIRFSSVNAAYEPKLMRLFGVRDIPSILLSVDKKTYIYREPSFKGQKIIGDYRIFIINIFIYVL